MAVLNGMRKDERIESLIVSNEKIITEEVREEQGGEQLFKNKRFIESYALNRLNSNQILTKGCKDWKSTSERNRRLTLTGVYGKAAKFRRQKKAAKTLGIVVGCFLLCWFPFFLVLPLDAACTSCDLPGAIFNLTFWLGYFNSCLNPFIYACSSRELRRAFRHILCFRRNISARKRHVINSEHCH